MNILFAILLLLVTSCAPSRDLSLAPKGEQRIVIRHRSGEMIDVVTRTNGQYNNDAFKQIDYIFRDRHTDEVYPVDPKLIDAIADLRDKLIMSPSDPIELLSGYRSRESNANLAKTNRYVAKDSYHMKGKAADIRLPGMNSSALEAVAKTMQKGGVALYPDSGHVHVDTGPVRGWSVVRGQEAGMRRNTDKPVHYHGRVPVKPDTQFIKPVKSLPNNSYDDLPMPKKVLKQDPVSKKAVIPTKASKIRKDAKPVSKTTTKAAPQKKSLESAKKQWVKTPGKPAATSKTVKPAKKTSKPVKQ